MAAKCLKSRTRWPWPEVQGELATRLFCHNFGGNARQHCKKANLPQKSRQIMAEGLCVVFSLQDCWRSSQTCFLAQLRSGGLAIKLEGCLDVSQVSNFKKGSFIFWYLTTSTLLACDKIFGVMTLYVCSSGEVLETQYGDIVNAVVSHFQF